MRRGTGNENAHPEERKMRRGGRETKALARKSLSLTNIARHYNFGVVEITPTDPGAIGILASAANIISKKRISIRQVITDDPTFSPEPKLTIITAKKLPGSLVPKFLEIKGVSKVTLY